jgi:hypothetical protein
MFYLMKVIQKLGVAGKAAALLHLNETRIECLFWTPLLSHANCYRSLGTLSLKPYIADYFQCPPPNNIPTTCSCRSCQTQDIKQMQWLLSDASIQPFHASPSFLPTPSRAATPPTPLGSSPLLIPTSHSSAHPSFTGALTR